MNLANTSHIYTSTETSSAIVSLTICSVWHSVMRFGERYYDSDISICLSIDPLSDKYPSMSPYMYCAGNPVILVDPDGRSYGHYVDGDVNVVGKDKNDDDRIFLVYGNDLSKVKADKFNKGVSQSKLSNPVELPSYEERQMLGCLYEQGINYKESELGLLMYNSESGSFRGEFYQSRELNRKDVGQYKQKGGINFSTAFRYDNLGDPDAKTPKIIAHLHNVSDMKTPPTPGGDNLGGGFKLGVVFDYDKNGHNTYIYNSKTKIRENSRMNTANFLKPFITPNGKNL